MPFDTRLAFAALQNPWNVTDSSMRLAELRSRQQDNELQQMKMDEYKRQLAQQEQVRNALRGAVVPAQTGTYQEPGMDIGGMQIPGRSVSVSNPAHFDQDKAYNNLLPVDPMAAEQMRQQREQAAQELNAKMNAQQKALAADQLEQSTRGFASVLNFPPDIQPQAYKQEVQRQLQQGIIHQDQIGSVIPTEFPGQQGMMGILQRASSIQDIIKRAQEMDSAVPLPAPLAPLAGKPEGTKVPLGTLNTLSEVNKRLQPEKPSVDEQSLSDWLKKNPSKGASDYTVWKAKHSATILKDAGGAGGGDAMPDAADPNSQSILAQTGLSYPAFQVLTGNSKNLPRDKATRAAAMKEAETWANKRGVDVSTMGSQYQAYNDVLKSNISRMANTKIMENELEGTIQNLQQVVKDSDLSRLNFANVAQIWAGRQVNDPLAQQYAMHLYQLRNELAAYGAATQGRSGNNITLQDLNEAEKTIKNGISKGSLSGLQTAVKNSTEKMGTVMQGSVDAANRAVWELFGVGKNYKGGKQQPKSDPLGIRN